MPKRTDLQKILIIGSGPIIISQACEFDYSGTQACKALRGLGYKIVLVNSNPATIMTDPAMADITYIEPLNLERMTQIIEKERPDAILPNLGGQSGLNLSSELRFKPDCPPRFGRRASGRSFSMISVMRWRLSGSMYVTSAMPGSVMMVAGFELTSTIW